MADLGCSINAVNTLGIAQNILNSDMGKHMKNIHGVLPSEWRQMEVTKVQLSESAENTVISNAEVELPNIDISTCIIDGSKNAICPLCSKDAVFIGRTHFFTTNTENIVIFRSGKLYSLCSPGNQDYQKIIHY